MFQIINEEPTKKIDKIIARREEIVERREERRMTDKNVKKDNMYRLGQNNRYTGTG
jgi:hypothetical protein